jgi:staphylococcal nuclease domain-containing protein 1
VARLGKGKPVQAIVEAVNSGSTLRVTLLPELQSATVMVAGVQCPSMGRRPPPAAAPAPATADGEEANGTGGVAPGSAAALVAAGTPATAPEAQPEPFAREARHFTELRTLNREVKVVLAGVSQFGVLVGSVLFAPPPGATPPPPEGAANGSPAPAAPAEQDLGSALVRAGLGRTAEWGLNMMTSGAFKLRELGAPRAAPACRSLGPLCCMPARAAANLSKRVQPKGSACGNLAPCPPPHPPNQAERAAKQGKVGMWHNYVPQTGNSAKLSDKFQGTVAEVVSGDCLVVKDKASGGSGGGQARWSAPRCCQARLCRLCTRESLAPA